MICIAKDTVFCEGNQQIPERATGLPAGTIGISAVNLINSSLCRDIIPAKHGYSTEKIGDPARARQNVIPETPVILQWNLWFRAPVGQ